MADPFAVAADDTGIWVTSEANDTITRFAPDGTTVATLSKSRDPEIPNGPSFLAIAGGSVWVASDVENVLVRIDARTDQVDRTDPDRGHRSRASRRATVRTSGSRAVRSA